MVFLGAKIMGKGGHFMVPLGYLTYVGIVIYVTIVPICTKYKDFASE